MDMAQTPLSAQTDSPASGTGEPEFRPEWHLLRARLGAAHGLRRELDRPGTTVPRGSFAPLAGWQPGVFSQADRACRDQGKEPVNPKALSNGKGGRAKAVGTAGTSKSGG
ncbi:MAG TPA: hypothetical protein PKD92_03830 [Novosphingobium sp.]|nr:hypothetical protein [Novosphingobium sp.]HMP55685.1 hypothetical protein [Novosphingobium sp.]